MSTMGVLIDQKNAFATLNHDILVTKLEHHERKIHRIHGGCAVYRGIVVLFKFHGKKSEKYTFSSKQH